VSAFDVRAAAKEQVESLGATFVCVEADESGDGGGGYAKEMSEAYKKAQHEKLAQVVKTQDIIITTALIPGKPAPLLITDDMVDSMKAGSVIIDLATESGGNCSASQFGETVSRNDVIIVGPANIASQIAGDTSQLYARNVFNYVKTLLLNSENELHIDMDDEIVKATVLTHHGEIVHPVLMSASAAPKKPRKKPDSKKEDPKKQNPEEA
jgi:NAD(P) transhydrogenase subunit alpha